MRSDSHLWFSVPNNFLESKKYVPSRRMFSRLGKIPSAVIRALLTALPPETPIDPMNCFIALKTGKLPSWLLIYFVRQQHNLDSPMTTKFFRALHLMEWVRAELIGVEYQPPTRAERRRQITASPSVQPPISDEGSSVSGNSELESDVGGVDK